MEVMRKFYRNRHSSFLQALSENKNKKEKEERALREAEERLRLQVKQAVLGDGSRIRSKVFDPQPREEMESA